LEFEDFGFCGGRKTGEPREKPSKQGHNQQQTHPTEGTGPESSPATLVGGEQIFHHYPISTRTG